MRIFREYPEIWVFPAISGFFLLRPFSSLPSSRVTPAVFDGLVKPFFVLEHYSPQHSPSILWGLSNLTGIKQFLWGACVILKPHCIQSSWVLVPAGTSKYTSHPGSWCTLLMQWRCDIVFNNAYWRLWTSFECTDNGCIEYSVSLRARRSGHFPAQPEK
jgi:hypothetical protein